jgi:hypothetical protein
MKMDCYLDSNKFDELCMNENEEYMTTNVYSFNDIIRYTKYLFYAFFLLFNGTVLSTIINSYSLHYIFNNINDANNKRLNDEDGSTDDFDEDIDYEYKYVTEFEELIKEIQTDMSDKDKLNLSKLVVMDSTPNGDVVMSYEHDVDDVDRSKFIYYANARTIPYKYLDAVARKYVYINKCPDVYLFIKNELMKEIDRIEEEIKREEERKKLQEEDRTDISSKKTDNIFASFKNYKSSRSISNPSIKRKHILVTKNKYKYMGTVDDYNRSLLPKNEAADVKPISFSEFKQLNSSS